MKHNRVTQREERWKFQYMHGNVFVVWWRLEFLFACPSLQDCYFAQCSILGGSIWRFNNSLCLNFEKKIRNLKSNSLPCPLPFFGGMSLHLQPWALLTNTLSPQPKHNAPACTYLGIHTFNSQCYSQGLCSHWLTLPSGTRRKNYCHCNMSCLTIQFKFSSSPIRKKQNYYCECCFSIFLYIKNEEVSS